MKSIPLGLENFKALIQSSYYVDHTSIIGEIENLPATTAVLILRPRRFGKSLTVSMLQTFYESSAEEKGQLFHGLKVADDSSLMAQPPAPVLSLCLKDLKSKDFPSFLNDFRDLMLEEYDRLKSLWGDKVVCPCLDQTRDEDVPREELKIAPYQLCKSLADVSGRKVRVLIDEYDTPISQAKAKGYFDEAISFFQFVYGKTLKGNDCLEKAVVTGIVRIAKQSLFSDANNFILDDGIQTVFSEPCGFTYEECKKLLEYYGVLDRFDEVKRWYGGYRFGDALCVNPWSVLSFLFYSKRFATYWVSTASNSELSSVFSAENVPFDALRKMLDENQTLSVDISENVNYQRMDPSVDSFLLFLRGAGYLSLEDYDDSNRATLRIPNHEIGLTLPREVLSRFMSPDTISELSNSGLRNAFADGNADLLERFFRERLLPTFSYFEFGSEKAYQIMVLTLTSLLFGDCIVKSEVIVGEGRCDIQISPKRRNCFGAIIEIKCLKSRTSQARLDESSKAAVRQIETHRYAEELEQRDARPIYAYGIAFQGKRVSIFKKCLRP